MKISPTFNLSLPPQSSQISTMLRTVTRLRSLLKTVPRLTANLSSSAPPAPISRRELLLAGGVSLLAGGGKLFILGFRSISIKLIILSLLGLLYLQRNKPELRLDSVKDDDSELPDPPSAFLFATGGATRKSPALPVYSRDDTTIIVVIGGPKGGKSEQAKRIAETFSMTLENGELLHACQEF